MLRTVVSVVAVIALVAVAGLLIVHYSHSDKPAGTDALAGGGGPPAPAAPPFKVPENPPAPLPPTNPANQPGQVTPPGGPGTVVEAPKPAPEAPPAAKRTHVVKSGESLWSISQKYYGRDYSSKIAAANNIKVTAHIRVGQVIALPDLKAKEPAPEAEEPETLANKKESGEPFVPQPPTLNTVKERKQ